MNRRELLPKLLGLPMVAAVALKPASNEKIAWLVGYPNQCSECLMYQSIIASEHEHGKQRICKLTEVHQPECSRYRFHLQERMVNIWEARDGR